MVTRRDGRSNTSFSTYSRCNNGNGWYFYDYTLQRIIYSSAIYIRNHSICRNCNSICYRNNCDASKRYQKSIGLFYSFSIRINVCSNWFWCVYRSSFPRNDACILQSVIVLRSRFCNSRNAPRARYAQNGRIEKIHENYAHHILDWMFGNCRYSWFIRFLF